MINSIVIDILVRKIKDKEINPKTNSSFVVEDILIEDYKIEVKKQLGSVEG